MNSNMNNITKELLNKRTNSLLNIEKICIKARKTFEDEDINPAAKAGLLAALFDEVYGKVIEGTETAFTLKK